MAVGPPGNSLVSWQTICRQCSRWRPEAGHGRIARKTTHPRVDRGSGQCAPTARRNACVFQDPIQDTAASLTVEEVLAIAVRHGSVRDRRLGLRRTQRNGFRAALEVWDWAWETGCRIGRRFCPAGNGNS